MSSLLNVGRDVSLRSRTRFDSDGNRYFRNLIQRNIGPYIGSRTKAEKGNAINRIVDIVKQSNPEGGFVRRDPTTGRWFRIKDIEARDKVGHAIRKAVQRLEETKPKLASRLKKEYTGKCTRDVSSSDHAISQEQQSPTNSPPTVSATSDFTKLDDKRGGGKRKTFYCGN